MEINVVNTPKKYEEYADEVISALFGLLKELLSVQERAALRFQRLEQKQLTIKEKSVRHTEIFDKCIEEYAAVIAGRCTEKEMQWKHPSSIGTCPEYAYIKGEFTVDLTIKKADTAVVIIHFLKDGRGRKHKFVLKLTDKKWLVDEVYSGYENERKWFYTEL